MNDVTQDILDNNCLKNLLLASQNIDNIHTLAKNCFITSKNEFCSDKR